MTLDQHRSQGVRELRKLLYLRPARRRVVAAPAVVEATAAMAS